MAAILSHPFRLTPRGTVAVVEQESDVADAEQIGVLVMTVIGERELVPGFGVTDPTFDGFLPGEISAGVAAYGPPVTITDVLVDYVSDSEQAVEVQFE